MTDIAQIDVKSLLRLDLAVDLVNNWQATSAVNDSSTTTYATAAAVKTTYDYAATKVPIALRTDWASKGILAHVIGQLAWQKNGNNSTIFDASNSLSPSGGAVDNTNATVQWTAGSPVLMGWNGTSTYGVRVDSARSADVLNNSYISASSQTLKSGARTILSGESASQLIINPAAEWPSVLIDSPLTLNGNLSFPVVADGVKRGIFGTAGTNDYWFVGGSSTSSDAGYMEISTGDNGTEPIYVRQYDGTPLTGSINRTATLLDASGNTDFPVQVTSPKFYANNWYHSTGATGWVNDTYGGGLYMTDTTWIRTYGGKKLLVGNTASDAIYTTGGVKTDLSLTVNATSWLAANTTHTVAALRQVSSPITVNFGTVSGTDDYYPIIDGSSTATTYGYGSRVSLGMYRYGGGAFSQAALVVGSSESANTTYWSYTFDAYGKANAATWNATGAASGQGLAYNGKTAIGGQIDTWLRLNPRSDFTSGIYCGAGVLRTDGTFQVGDAGAYLSIDATGKLTNNAEIITKSTNSYRMIGETYGSFWRNYNSTLYLLVTNSADQYGNYNALRPIQVNMGTGLVTFSNGLSGELTGNASTATKLATARTINTVSFDGSANIVVEPYIERDDSTNATRYLTFVDSATDGHQRLNIDVGLGYNPSTNTIVTNIGGNAATATKLTTARTIAISGGATGTATGFDGTANISIAVTSLDATKLSGVVPNANLSGTYTGFNITGNAGTATKVTATADVGEIAELVRGKMATNDWFRIVVGGATDDLGWAEIATADNGIEPIYVRQYSGDFVSLTRTATLLDGSGNTSFPVQVTAPKFIGSHEYGVVGGAAMTFDGVPVIRRYSGDNNRSIGIGGDDCVFIGAGESTGIMYTNAGSAGEAMHIGAESGIFLHVTPDNWASWGTRKTLQISSGGITWDGGNIWHDGLGTKNRSSNGYEKLPSGLIIQWGYITVTPPAYTGGSANSSVDHLHPQFSANVTFPIAFPTALLGISPSAANSSYTEGSEHSAAVGSVSTTGATFVATRITGSNGGSETMKILYIAIGY